MNFVSKDELMLKLAKELGPSGFNDWFKETFGKPAPYIYYQGSMGRFKSERFKVKKHLIEGEENE